MDDLRVVEAAHHLEECVDRADVRQESITEASPGRRATGQPGDVVDREIGGDLGAGLGGCSAGFSRWRGGKGGYLVVVAEPVVARIGDNNTSFFGLDGCVWEILW